MFILIWYHKLHAPCQVLRQVTQILLSAGGGRLEVCELQCLGFWPFVITHFNILFMTFHDWWNGMRPHGWQVSFCHTLGIVQVTLSSVKLHLLSFEIDCFHISSCNDTHSIIQCILSWKKVYILLKINSCLLCFLRLFYFCYWYVISFCNQIGILHCKWLLMLIMLIFMMVCPSH